jgi:hypothetical protein
MCDKGAQDVQTDTRYLQTNRAEMQKTVDIQFTNLWGVTGNSSVVTLSLGASFIPNFGNYLPG